MHGMDYYLAGIVSSQFVDKLWPRGLRQKNSKDTTQFRLFKYCEKLM